MTVLLVLAFFILFLTIDWFKMHPIRLPKGTMYTTPGFEALGAHSHRMAANELM
jgi:hypothetical protein